MPLDAEGAWHVVELLADILADTLELAVAAALRVVDQRAQQLAGKDVRLGCG